tara:strand:- start:281 stop:652 length:372 start_codon:yes stop_codon:yes gene_type:complete
MNNIHPCEIERIKQNSLMSKISFKEEDIKEINRGVNKSEYINRREHYDWPIVIATTFAGTLITLAPFVPIGYWLEKNDYKKGIPPNKSKIKSSYLPALCVSICVAVGLNNVNKGSSKNDKQYR